MLLQVIALCVGAQISYADHHHEHPAEATCVMRLHDDGTAIGTVTMIDDGTATFVSIALKSDLLVPGLHGFHIHEDPVDGVDCVSTGSHYNPFDKEHSAPVEYTNRHVGDLGNVIAVGDGVVDNKIVDSMIQLRGPYSIIGRAVVIHAGEDDLGLGGDEESKSTGNAGSRVACCTIEAVQGGTMEA